MKIQQRKSDSITSKIWIEYKWVIEENWVWSVDPVTVQETLDLQLEELREGKIINVTERSSCERKDDDVLEEVILAKRSQ